MTVDRSRSCQGFLQIQTATVIIGTLSIVGGLLSAYFLSTNNVPAYCRVFYIVNGLLNGLFGAMVIYAVAENKPKFLEPFLLYQMFTLIFSSVAMVFAVFDEPQIRKFVVNMNLGGHGLKHSDDEIESELLVMVFAFHLFSLFILPTLYLFVVLRCYIHLKDNPKNLNTIIYRT